MTTCPVCGTTEWKEAYKIDRWDIDECTVCGFARIDPLPMPEARHRHYSKEKVIQRNIKEKTQQQNFSRAIKRLFSKATKRNKSEIFYNKLSCCLSPGAKILDIGCGDGSFLKLAKKKFICTGIEISEYLAALAGKQSDIKVKAGNFLSTDFADEKYDGITLISLLEHLSDPIQAIKKCFDLMNNNGILLIKTVNYGCLNRRIKKEAWTGFRPPDHVIYFTPANLKHLLKKIGFTKVKISAWAFNDNMYCDAWK
jgi:2-polyprenyl-3-methyl-5-hydroxy-6-metoxy-1,4-benzoquinol methylase